jgi:hypothetical protein
LPYQCQNASCAETHLESYSGPPSDALMERDADGD